MGFDSKTLVVGGGRSAAFGNIEVTPCQ